jgi:hypothetical protein
MVPVYTSKPLAITIREDKIDHSEGESVTPSDPKLGGKRRQG